MTQAELGEQLNVTAQAVSKWENGLSEPDIATIQRLCKIFGISLEDLLSGEEIVSAEQEQAHEQEEVVPTPASAPVQPIYIPVPTPTSEPTIIVGYCDDCKRPIQQGEKYEVVPHRGGRQDIYCPKCSAKRASARAASEAMDEHRRFKKGMIVGAIVAAIIAAVIIATAIVVNDPLVYVGLVAAICVFTAVSQAFWAEFVMEIMSFFLRSIKLPGLIFTLDLDGIIWFILVKVGLSILAGIAGFLFFLLGMIVTAVISLVTFPFCLIWEIGKMRRLDADAKAAEETYKEFN